MFTYETRCNLKSLNLVHIKTRENNDPFSLHKANAAGNYLFLYMTVLLFPRHCNGDVR